MVVDLTVTGSNKYRCYKKNGCVYVTFDDKLVTFVGDIPRKGQMTIFKFPSKQAAKDWYADESYQALSEFRRAGLTLGHGLLWRFDSLV